MTQNTGFILNGLPIEYLNIQMNEHYQKDSAFIAVKAVEMFLIEYSQTGLVTYSNNEIMNRLECSKRGLQIALNQLEAVDHNGHKIYDIIERTYADPEKRNRTGIKVNIDTAIKWLSAKNKDVSHLQRGNLFKHFVHQSVIVVRTYAKKLRKAIEAVKTAKNKAKWEAIINDLNNEKAEHESYINKCVKRAKKALKKGVKEFADGELKSSYWETVIGFGFTPPNHA
ncbi:MAG: hypothetical protein K8Q99_02070 [Acholeplasmataceae bacterium]|nr:hypothetical protein [Acholeplasmataceae bacterium]MCD4826552.1 hypothetical protein [Acholeplasmataceae bacterium]